MTKDLMRPFLLACLLAAALLRIVIPGSAAAETAGISCNLCGVTAEFVLTVADQHIPPTQPDGTPADAPASLEADTSDPSLDHADTLTPPPPPSPSIEATFGNLRRPASWRGVADGGFDPPLRPPSSL